MNQKIGLPRPRAIYARFINPPTPEFNGWRINDDAQTAKTFKHGYT